MPPPKQPRRLLLAGATGLVGRAVLQCLAEQAQAGHSRGPVVALLRRPADAALSAALAHARGEALVHPRLSGAMALPPTDDVLIALGTTIAVAGSPDAFRAVDFDAVVAVARAARAAGAERIAVVSALGADSRSSVFYNRVKGEMEAAVTAVGFPSLVIGRPSLLAGNRAALGQPVRTGEQWALRLMRPIQGLIPPSVRPIEARLVARALLGALDEGAPGVLVLPSAEMARRGAG
ncbi:NAD(P)H-binding protein [Ideonella sp. DXS29W]|uniref:NAD(P)H-binding protein n=1 Tax=Ideonella lacteola TaxID=2984193 RepID=A0ABU9BNT2_9BURK